MTREYIAKLFPEINDIKDGVIRKGVVDVWLLAMKRGHWRKIDDIPFTLLSRTRHTLVLHTRMVTRMAMAVAQERHDLDNDLVIAGGIIHDVGKLLEYRRKGKRFVKSFFGRRVRHPVSGYCLALEAGLPLELAHIVAAHSAEGEDVERSKEAILIHHCDFIDFEMDKS
jgi:putative nucleotidyltransferase with HDIG domain